MPDYDRYDRGWRGRGRDPRDRGYGADYRRGYDRSRGPVHDPSFAGASFPMGPGYMPMGWGWYGPFGMAAEPFPYGPPFAPGWDDRRPPRRPEDSPAYGRGGDRELRRWAREHGYDVEYTVYPRGYRRPR
jgi:hypothetical protein